MVNLGFLSRETNQSSEKNNLQRHPPTDCSWRFFESWDLVVKLNGGYSSKPCVIARGYPLVNVYITMENHHFSWENSLEMAMFNSYVELPEDTWNMGVMLF